MEEKPWRTNMKKVQAKREGEGEDDEKEEEKEEEEEAKSDKNDDGDELAKRPWRNNMRETIGKSAQGKHHTSRIMLSGRTAAPLPRNGKSTSLSISQSNLVFILHTPNSAYLYALSSKFQPRPPRALKSIGNGRPRRRRR